MTIMPLAPGDHAALLLPPGSGLDAFPPLIALANTVEARIPYWHAHAARVAVQAVRVAGALMMTPSAVERVHAAALLHDIGKIVVPDALLMKPSVLTEDEWRVMRSHAPAGAAIVALALPELEPAVRHHHERWDGRGYPDGLRGIEIPFEARLIAVADAWDAMTAERPYRPPLSFDAALAELRSGRGQLWDADLVDVFLSLEHVA